MQKVRLAGLLQAAAFVVAFLSIATLADHSHRLLELFTHFRLQYIIASIVFAIVFFALRQRGWAILMVTIVAINGYLVAPYYVANASEPDARLATVTIIHANVRGHDNEPGEFIEWLQSRQADIVFVQEIDGRWADALRSLDGDYPYQKLVPRVDNHGIGVVSRLEFLDDRLIGEPDHGAPSLLVKLAISDRLVTILSSHPPPPIGRDMTAARNGQLGFLADTMRSIPGPKILTGDLNISMWAYHYEQLLDSTGLRNARRGRGVMPSWPTFFPIAMIPIDHCLVSSELAVTDMHTGPAIGSDHLPLVAVIGLKN